MRSLTMMAAGLALLAATPVRAQQADADALPAAHELITRYVAALGGEDALRRHTSRYAMGRLEVPAQGIGGDIELFSAAPNKFVVRTEIAGMGLIQSGYDGSVAWTIHPAMGPMLLDGRMLDQMRQQADFLVALHPERLIKSVETVERTEFEGQPSFKVKILTQWDEEYFEFFDAENGLLLGSTRQQASPMGDIPVTVLLSDYQDVDGVLIPMKSVQRLLGMEQVVTLSTMEVDAVSDSVFALPAEIKALLPQ